MLGRSDRLLIGIVLSKRDLSIFEEKRWYRIPVDAFVTKDEETWPPGWVAAFEGVRASGAAQQVLRYAEVVGIRTRTREELFSGLPSGDRAGRQYYQVLLGPVQYLPKALIPPRRRRTTFIETSIDKLRGARTFNDLFSGGRFEDDLWNAFQAHSIDAERQWHVSVDRKRYVLDFALFCRERNIDVEIDGRQHHAIESRSEYDADRDKDLTRKGWAVQRFRAEALQNGLSSCLAEVSEAIEKYGGLPTAEFRLIPRSEGVTKQLVLLEQRQIYDANGDGHL